MSCIADFANESRSALTSKDNPITFVLGNEACDLDSMACAIIYSCFLQETLGMKRTVIPVLNIAEQEMDLRRDNLFVLKECGIKPSSLVFTDTFSFQDFAAKVGTEIVLVDHNELSIFQEYLEPLVVSIIDHHVDGGLGKGKMEVRVVEECGSCMSLVLRELEKAKSKLCVDPVVAFCAVAAILSDTGRLNPELKKTTDLDVRFFKKYATEMKLKDEAEFYDELTRRRRDLSGFSLTDLMGKDAKFFKVPKDAPKENRPGEPFGVSTIVTSFENMEQQSKFCYDDLCKFGASRKLFLFFVLTAFTENKSFRRELGIFTSDYEFGKAVIQKLDEDESFQARENLKIKSCPNDFGYYFQTWTALNPATSRKKFIPLIRSVLRLSRL